MLHLILPEGSKYGSREVYIEICEKLEKCFGSDSSIYRAIGGGSIYTTKIEELGKSDPVMWCDAIAISDEFDVQVIDQIVREYSSKGISIISIGEKIYPNTITCAVGLPESRTTTTDTSISFQPDLSYCNLDPIEKALKRQIVQEGRTLEEAIEYLSKCQHDLVDDDDEDMIGDSISRCRHGCGCYLYYSLFDDAWVDCRNDWLGRLKEIADQLVEEGIIEKWLAEQASQQEFAKSL